ncbi:MAG: 23S rRNA (guanosine(2251)-2'-O)-methyltransferase RlmB [Alphaproteobacteria bacterium]|nr:23S rRNA (guanosine(2251)-2'-O)-methyltransferase RlmB [Alphaproteobacteria bacterium]
MARKHLRDRSDAPRRDTVWLYGRHAVTAALANPSRAVYELHATPEALDQVPGTLTARPGLTVTLADRARIGTMVPSGAVHQDLALRAAPLPQTTLDDVLARPGPKTIVVLDQVTDPHNVGAILRSAAAFGAAAVVVTARNAAPPGPTVAKAASGALDLVPLVQVVNLARALEAMKTEGIWCLGLDAEGGRPLTTDLPGPSIALVLGAEGDGLRRLTRERCDAIVSLPTVGPLASLNVSNAAAIALYIVSRR